MISGEFEKELLSSAHEPLFQTQSPSLYCHVDIHMGPSETSQAELLSTKRKGGPNHGKNKRAKGSDEERRARGNGIPEGWVGMSLALVPRIWLSTSWSLCLSVWPFSDLDKSTRGLEFSVVEKAV